MFSLSYSPQVKAQSNPCAQNYNPCPDEVWYSYSTVFYHPLFPTCMINASVHYKRCLDGTYYYYVNWIDYPNSGSTSNSDCIALIAWLNADPSRISQLYELAIDVQAHNLFVALKDANPTDPKILCPNGHTSLVSSTAKCKAFCYYEDTQNARMVAVPRICSDGCCTVEHTFCWDAENQVVVETRTVVTSGSSAACTGSTTTCAPSIVRKDLTGTGTHTVLLDSVGDCITSTTCE